MSNTDKKSKTRKERGLNVRVVQEQKEKRSDGVRVNSWEKKNNSKKKVVKNTSTEDPKADIKKEIKKLPKSEEIIQAREPMERFEVLTLHTDTDKRESRIILRDVAKEKQKDFARLDAKVSGTRARGLTEEKREDFAVVDRKAIFGLQTKPSAKGRQGDFTKSDKEVPKARTRVCSKSISSDRLEVPLSASAKTSKPVQPAKKLSASEIKDREIKKAINMATRLPEVPKKSRSRWSNDNKTLKVILATTCFVTAIVAIVCLVNLGHSGISLGAAAERLGIDAVYPSYTPRGYTLADVTSSNDKVTMTFKSDSGSYTITEEQAVWNSSGLLANFIKPTYGSEYTVIEEQGLALYMGERWGAWVNGGVLYKLTINSGSLTKKQIKTIATSL